MVRALSKKGILGMTASTVKGAGVQGGVCSRRCCAAAYVKLSGGHTFEAAQAWKCLSSRDFQAQRKWPRQPACFGAPARLGSRALLPQCKAPSLPHPLCCDRVLPIGTGKKERYSGTEHGSENLVEKARLDIVVFR